MTRPVMVVIGAGGMGSAIARRSGYGKTLVLADFDADRISALAAAMSDDGYDVHPQQVDIGDRTSVRALAEHAGSLGEVSQFVLTAGVSPMMASVEAILRVDLVGSAIVLEEFATVISSGGAGVMIASMSGSFVPLPPELERELAVTPADELLANPLFGDGVLPNSGAAYSVAKRANQVRVRAAAVAWGERGARINSISPGIISTVMGKLELEGDSGPAMRTMLDGSPVPRQGTPEDIAHAADFLLDPRSSFITGVDLLVDGGVVSGGPGRPYRDAHRLIRLVTETAAIDVDKTVLPRRRKRKWLYWLVAVLALVALVVYLWGDDKSLIDGHLDGPEAYLIVIALVFGDAIFPVLPGETTVNAATVLAQGGDLSVWLVMASAAAGAVLGDSALYWIARTSHRPIRARLDKAVDGKAGQTVIGMLTRYGSTFIVFGRYVPGLRFAINVTLGAVVKMPYRRFLFWSSISGVLWAAVTCFTAYFISSALDGYPILSFFISTFLGTALIGSCIWLRSRFTKPTEKTAPATS